MANGNFIVQNGLEVGGYKVFAGNGDIITTGNISTTGGGSITSAAGFGGLNPDKIYTGSSNVSVTAASVFSNIAGTKVTEVTSGGLAVTGALSATSTLGVTGATTLTTATTGGLQAVAIGNVTPGTGAFTTVSASGVTSVTNNTASTATNNGALVVTGGVGVGGAINVTGASTFASDVNIAGVLTVANLQARGSVNIVVQDPMTYFQANVLYPWTYDTGLYSDSIGGAANTYVHHGMVRNYVNSEWTFFSNVKSEPSNTINWSDTGLVYDQIKTGHHVPGANVTYNLGSTTAYWSTIYGVSFVGTSTTAKYADLAENYQGDAHYMPGQVVEFGGDYEVTLGSTDSITVAGIVSTNPAHLMNGGLNGPNVVAVALQGRVPCNVIGPVKKGQMMVSAGFGYARASNNPTVGQVIGKALSDFTGAKGQIEVVVGRC